MQQLNLLIEIVFALHYSLAVFSFASRSLVSLSTTIDDEGRKTENKNGQKEKQIVGQRVERETEHQSPIYFFLFCYTYVDFTPLQRKNSV